MSIDQESRVVAISTPLGKDVLAIKKMEGSEQLGRLFEFELELLSDNHSIVYDDILGQNVTLRLQMGNDQTRYFNGYLSQFTQVEQEGEHAVYKATLVPWLWFLTQASDCRIFQEMKSRDIIEAVFKALGFADYELRLTGEYLKREYCVQYRETDFEFVSRLMEQDGIYTFFTHEDGKHTLVLADSVGAHEDCPGYEQVDYRPSADKSTEPENILEWSIHNRVLSGSYAHNAFDFKKPSTNLTSRSDIQREHAASEFQRYDYGSDGYTVVADGETYSKVRIEEVQARHRTFVAQTDARGMCYGHTFSLDKHPREDQNRKYLITRIIHKIVSDIGSSGSEPMYGASLTAIEDDTPFRTPRITHRSVVEGPQTALVVGPSSEEIHVDEHGRVKVQFHWDRYSKADDKSSCWVRVSQNWAGKKWGAFFLPRVGQEVIVDFLEGDPDRPIITGRVYNGEAKPPYDLPANKTRSTIKTNSSKGGAGFNELRFEDKKGEEQIFIHAEKNQDVRVKNDSLEWIGNDRHLIVKNNQMETVEVDKHSIVKGNQLVKIEGDHSETTVGDHLYAIEGGDHLAVTGDKNTKVDGDISLEGAKNINQKAGMKLSVEAGMDYHEKAGMNYAMEAGQAVHIKAGMTAVIEAGLQLTIKVGGNFIDINPAGVFIKGTMVMINSGGAAGSGAGSSPTAPVAPDPPEVPEETTEAADEKAGETSAAPKAPKPPKPVTYSASAKVMKFAAQDGTPFCAKCEEAKKKQAAGGGS